MINFYQYTFRSNQDRGKHWVLEDGNEIFAIADGHGTHIFADLIISTLDLILTSGNVDFSVEDLTMTIDKIFDDINQGAKNKYQSVYGGSTFLLLILRPGKDFWIANVGDSTAVIFDKENSTFDTLTEDHSASNIEEAKRILSEFPEAIFEFDRRAKMGPTFPMYDLTDEGIKKRPIPIQIFTSRMLTMKLPHILGSTKTEGHIGWLLHGE